MNQLALGAADGKEAFRRVDRAALQKWGKPEIVLRIPISKTIVELIISCLPIFAITVEWEGLNSNAL